MSSQKSFTKDEIKELTKNIELAQGEMKRLKVDLKERYKELNDEKEVITINARASDQNQMRLSEIETEMKEKGIGADLDEIHKDWSTSTESIFKESNLVKPEGPPAIARGKQGVHTEHMGYMLAQLQYMQRTYPEMEW